MRHFRKILPLLAILLLFACKQQERNTRRDYLKEYAFCQCLKRVKDYKYEEAMKADISTGVYFELSRYAPEVYTQLDSAAANAAALIQPSALADHEGKKAVLMQCFQFYKSKSLDSLVKRMDRKMLDGWR